MNKHNKKSIGSRVFLFLLLLLPNLYALFAASDLRSPSMAVAYMAVVVMGLVLPMLLLRARAYFIVTGVLFLFCAPIEIASLFLNSSPATSSFVGLIYATNWREAVGVLTAVAPLVAGVLTLWFVYFLLAARQPNEWLIPRKAGLWAAGIGLPILLAGAMFYFGRYARDIYNLQAPREVIRQAGELAKLKFYKIYPYNIYLNTYRVAADRQAARQAQEALAPFRFGIQADNDTTSGLFVLVIGESARSENFGINDYERPTTPRLAQRTNLVSYPQMYSVAGVTEPSVSHIISRIPVTHHDAIYSEKTLPEAFQEAGYTVTWITNKSRAFYLERLLETVDKRYETGKDMSAVNNYDAYLLTPFEETVRSGTAKQLVVVHTMGSHWRYDTRYPKEFEQFTPSIGEDFQLSMISPANRQLLLNAYDNTILYTDFLLDSLITIMENKHVPAVMLYLSDHGENLYDDERQLVLHGNYSSSRWLYHVPFLVWYSDEYAALHPEHVHCMKAHADSRDNSSVVFPSLLDAAGLTYIQNTAGNAYSLTRSIFSDSYAAPDTLFVLTSEKDCIVLDE